MKEEMKPRPYDLDKVEEVLRLVRECHGYLHTCRRDHHGTDFEGRQHAMTALHDIGSGKYWLQLTKAADRTQTEA